MANTTNTNGLISALPICYNQVLPLVFDDSITYLQMQAKIVRKLNEVIDFTKINSIKYANPLMWDITEQYEANTVVVDKSGNAYLSVQPVPAGIALEREEYWTKIGNFDILWDNVKKGITPYDELQAVLVLLMIWYGLTIHCIWLHVICRLVTVMW